MGTGGVGSILFLSVLLLALRRSKARIELSALLWVSIRDCFSLLRSLIRMGCMINIINGVVFRD